MKKLATQSGFSLVETLVAITILLLVIVGPMTISSSSARSTTFASEQVTAFFLAQEGAELIEKVRNELVLENFAGSNPDPWTDFKNPNGPLGFCHTSNGCNLSFNTTPPNTAGNLSTVRSCSNQDGCVLFLDTSNASVRSKYNTTNAGTRAVYTRRIVLQTNPSDPNEVFVTSVVSWRSGFSRDEQQVSVQTSLFNVYGNN